MNRIYCPVPAITFQVDTDFNQSRCQISLYHRACFPSVMHFQHWKYHMKQLSIKNKSRNLSHLFLKFQYTSSCPSCSTSKQGQKHGSVSEHCLSSTWQCACSLLTSTTKTLGMSTKHQNYVQNITPENLALPLSLGKQKVGCKLKELTLIELDYHFFMRGAQLLALLLAVGGCYILALKERKLGKNTWMNKCGEVNNGDKKKKKKQAWILNLLLHIQEMG